jgi:hypothetical protein
MACGKSNFEVKKRQAEIQTPTQPSRGNEKNAIFHMMII